MMETKILNMKTRIDNCLLRIRAKQKMPISIRITSISKGISYANEEESKVTPFIAWTNFKDITFNLEELIKHDEVEHLSSMHLAFIYAHEVSHILHSHDLRLGDKIHELWNTACDYYINSLLVTVNEEMKNKDTNEDLWIPIKNILLKEEYSHKNFDNAEGIYYELLKDNNKKLKELLQDMIDQLGKGSPNPKIPDSEAKQDSKELQKDLDAAGDNLSELGEVLKEIMSKYYQGNHKNEQLSEEQQEELRQSVNQIYSQVQIANSATGIGSETNSLDRLILEYWEKPAVNWQSEVRKFRSSLENNDEYSYKRINKVGLGYGIINPSVIKENGKSNILVMIDTSGSISDKVLAEIKNELVHLSKHCNISKIDVDTEVHGFEEFNSTSEVKKIARFVGGGGTTLSAGFKYVKTNKFHFDAFIGFTDSFTDNIDTKYKNLFDKVLWIVMHSGQKIVDPDMKKRLGFGRILLVD